MRIGRVEVEPIAKEAAREFRDDDVPGLAAQTAYQLIFSLPPAAIFFAALSAIVDRYTGVDVFGRLLDILRGALPGDVYQPVDTIISQIRRGGAGLLSIGFVVALWSAAGAVDALIKAFNVAYDVIDQRSFVKRKAMDIGLTIGLGVLVIVAFVLFVFGQRLALWLAGYAGLGSAFALAFNIARWPIILVAFMFVLAVLYWAGPAVDQSFRWISPGAVLATLLWVVATAGFSVYLRVSNPGSAYGALGTVVVLLFYLYLASIILLAGAELNAVLDKRFDPQVVRDKAAHPERQTDPEAARQRAIDLAAREGKSPEEFGVRPPQPAPVPTLRPARPSLARQVGALVASILLAALLGVIRVRRRLTRA